MYYKTILFIFSSIILISCNNSQSTPLKRTFEDKTPAIIIESPINNETYTIGDTIFFKYSIKNYGQSIDSIVLYINKKRYDSINLGQQSIYWKDKKARTGKNIFSFTTYFNGSSYTTSVSVVLLSDFIPMKYTFNTIRTYSHDIHSYTQGLIFEKNKLYESAGMYNQSTLRKISIEGKIEKLINIEGRYFAEGLTMLNGKLYQLTWREQTAFVYLKDDFTLLKTLPYTVGEGWGLTNDGTNLIMSDGSEFLYIMDSSSLKVTSRLEVYSDKGPVRNLNELELVGDNLYANIYQTDQIAIIEMKTGKILAFIDCSNLLQENDKHSNIDVLNGIAYNPSNKHFYITGKNWPKLFEVTFIKK